MQNAVAIFTGLLTLQARLNTITIGPDWQKADKDWFLAISQECAEGIDHLGWKWWAKQVPDKEAAQVEVADILHFTLSAEMAYAPKHAGIDDIARLLETQYNERDQTIVVDNMTIHPSKEDAVALFQLISGLACVGRVDTGLLFLLGERLGLDAIALARLYQMKATLNLFRQNNGYKDGTYIKHWAPSCEDNTFLPALAEGLDWTRGDAHSLFYNRLNEKYREMTAAMRRH